MFDGNLSSAGMDYLWVPTPATFTAPAGQTVTKPAGTLQGTANSFGSLSVEMVDSSQIHGSLSVAADGSYTYTPDAAYIGEAWFTYQIRDTGPVSGDVPGLSLYVTAFFDVNSNVPVVDVTAAGGTASQTDGDNPNYAASADPARFVFTRNGDLTQSLTANVTVSGIAVKGTDYRWAAADAANNIVSLDGGTIQFPAGQSTVKAILVPINSGTPEWTRDVKVQVAPHSSGGSVPAYEVGESPSAAQNITGADLKLKLGDGSNGQIIQGSSDGTQYLVPMTLTFPSGYVTGQEITLTEPLGADAKIWATASPGLTDKPLLNGPGSLTLPANQMPTEVWVGATAGSANVGDLKFTLAANDANVRHAPTGTYYMVASNADSAEILRIIPITDPGQLGKSDWNNVKQKWIVGERATLEAELSGPFQPTDSSRYTWTVPGNVLDSYTITPDTSATATVTHLAADQTAPDGMQVGTSDKRVRFFWVSGSGAQKVSVAITNVQATDGQVLENVEASTTFDLTTPDVSGTQTKLGIPQLYRYMTADNTIPERGDWGVHLAGIGSDANGNVNHNGFEARATVKLPSQWTPPADATPLWNVVQLDRAYGRRLAEIPGGNKYQELILQGQKGLDTEFPVGNTPYTSNELIAPYNTSLTLQNVKGWKPGTSAGIYDTPGSGKGGLYKLNGYVLLNYFTTTIMFNPGTQDSQFVPLQSVDWNFQVGLVPLPTGPSTPPPPTNPITGLPQKAWTFYVQDPTIGTPSPDFVPTSEVPTWSINMAPNGGANGWTNQNVDQTPGAHF